MGWILFDDSPTIEDTVYIVAPYAADIDTEVAGTVYYTDHPITTEYRLDLVSRFVKSQTNESFSGTKMVIAHWQDVSLNLRHGVTAFRKVHWMQYCASVCSLYCFYLREEPAISKAF